ncbi:nuclear transport factor 2 family protein [Streptomyces pseudovenezuelae]|uniref:nuclear transport factor 2 family protein n=1 Tax=Streptomyces pseudovenezuelae TaxID=67350 RepID=UPI002E81CCDD|nr:nuclear transport factor 2 family protein [Streptomyces pseudovenezuelae]WUA89807.1 ester cyclase [Streptomyces pseudovenezuelae]
MPPTTPARRAVVAFLAAAAVLGATAVPAAAASHGPAAGHAAHGQRGYGDLARLGYQKAVAITVVKRVFERGDTAVVDRFVRPDYIQHNPTAADGSAGLKGLATSIHQQFPEARYTVKRAVSEGDLVLLHSNVVLVPGTKGASVIDIFRFQGGRIAEHWDVIQNVPDTTASGNDMFSTLSSPQVSQPLDHRLTQANKALVTKAFDELMVHKDLSALDRYWDPGYLQHNPQMLSGVPAAKAGLGGYFASAPQLTVTPKRIIAEGDLVAVHSHYVNYPGDRGSAILDLFRVRNGKIVEHWDIIQAVPETSANGNGMF